MCDAIADAFQTSPVELRQWVNYVDVLDPFYEHPIPYGVPFDYGLGNADEVKGVKYTAYGIRLQGTLTCPTIPRFTYEDADYPVPTPYKCRIVVACDHQPQNDGPPFFRENDQTSLASLYHLAETASSWPTAPRLVNSYRRFTVLAEKLYIFNPHIIQYRQTIRGTIEPTEGSLLAFNHTDGEGDRSSRFVHDTTGKVIGAGLFPIGGLTTVGTVEGPGVGVNALDATTTDPDRDIEAAGIVTGEPFEVTGTFNSYLDLVPTVPEWMYPVTHKVDFDIPFPRPVDVQIANQGFRCALTNRFVFWIVPDFIDDTGQPPHAFKFHFQGFTELLFTDY